MTRRPLPIHIVGLKKTGKSRLVESLVRELGRLGARTAVLKHDGSGHFRWDTEGTDTYKVRAAGSPVTAILSNHDFAVHASDGLRVTLPQIVETFFQGFDILLVEGFKRLEGRKVEVLREGVSADPLCPEEDLIATFGDRLPGRDAPHFDPEDVPGLAKLLFQLFREKAATAVPQAAR